VPPREEIVAAAGLKLHDMTAKLEWLNGSMGSRSASIVRPATRPAAKPCIPAFKPDILKQIALAWPQKVAGIAYDFQTKREQPA
jgi:hypothetical protein